MRWKAESVFLRPAFYRIFIDHWNVMGVSSHFNIHRNRFIHYYKLISRQVTNLKSMGRGTKPRSGGSSLLARTSNKINQVRAALRENPKFSARSFTRIKFYRSFYTKFYQNCMRFLRKYLFGACGKFCALIYIFFIRWGDIPWNASQIANELPKSYPRLRGQ